MIPRVEYRLIRPDEIEQAREKFKQAYSWAALPRWESTKVKVIEGDIKGLYDVQLRTVVANCVSFDNSPLTLHELIIDANASLANMQQWEFIVPDANPKMQKFLKERYGLVGQKEVPHKIYVIERSQYAGKK